MTKSFTFACVPPIPAFYFKNTKIWANVIKKKVGLRKSERCLLPYVYLCVVNQKRLKEVGRNGKGDRGSKCQDQKPADG